MKIACLSFTRQGEVLGKKLEENETFHIKHISNRSIEGGIKSIMSDIWKEYEGIIFISATGISVRYIAPFIDHKAKDPAIVVVDDGGKFSISLLSGHLGGANKLAEELASFIGGQAVITTASDNRGFQSLDIFAKENNYFIEDMKRLTKISRLMVDGNSLGFYSEEGKIPDYPRLKIIKDLDLNDNTRETIDRVFRRIKTGIDGLIIITSSRISPVLLAYLKDNSIAYTILRPKNINLGIGSRKEIPKERIIQAIEEALASKQLSPKSLKSMATVEVKKDEEGIIEAAKYYDIPLKIYSLGEIKRIEDKFEKSEFVRKTIGVASVSEPSAYLLGGSFVLKKGRYDGITISITKEKKNG